MNYEKIYNQLIEKAKPRGLNRKSVDYYTEIHHIIPRSMGGSDEKSNLVMLSGREHYMAHMLLWKAYPSKGALAYAAMMMSNRDVCKVNSYVYSALKEDYAKEVSKRRRGKCYKDLTGQKFTKLTVIELADFYTAPSGSRQAQWVCECDCGNFTTVPSGSLVTKNTQSCGCLVAESGAARSGEKNYMFGRKHSEETKAKFKFRRTLRGEEHPFYGKKLSEEHCRAMSVARTGVPWSEARREAEKLYKLTGDEHPMYGKSHSEESLRKMSESQKARNNYGWKNVSTQTDESMLKWAMSDYYYDLWIAAEKPGLKRFTKIYNETHDDNVSLAFFTNPRLNWLNGWVPEEDSDWREFSENHLKEAA